MKTLITGLTFLISFSLNAQTMKHPNDAVNQLFVSSDQRDWNMVEQIFDDNVLLDYSSMSGNPAASLTPEAITTAWKGVLPGFEYTHHQIGNMLTTIDDNTAKVFCYGTATHYLTDEEGNVWTVVGSYDFDLRLDAKDNWRVTSMKFNFKYQDGNTSLPEKAINRLK